MISRLARAGCLGRSSSGWVSSVGAAPSPSHATGLPAAGVQPFPNAQQFASISAATRNAMHFEIIVIILQRCNQRSVLTLAPPLHQDYTGQTQKPSNARPTQPNANIEQTIAAADAKVAIAFTDLMTRTLCGVMIKLCSTTGAQSRRNS